MRFVCVCVDFLLTQYEGGQIAKTLAHQNAVLRCCDLVYSSGFTTGFLCVTSGRSALLESCGLVPLL